MYIFLLYSFEFFLVWKIFQMEVGEKFKTHYMFNKVVWILCLYEIIWKNMIELCRPQDHIIWHMHCACWMTRATDTNSEYLILIAFPQQQWLYGHAWVLRFTWVTCLVFYYTGKQMWLTETGKWSFWMSGFSSPAKACVFSYFVS
jgi:hypothetical protein